MMDKRVLIGMSGGVDSSTAAYLACQEGYCCTGATMELVSGGADAADARSVAQRLGMEHVVLPFQQAFSQQVIQPFVDSYEQGLTPNPCIRCNQALKFGVLLDWALEQGYDYVASGHYARLRRDENTGRYLLYQAADPAKDQTYFLAGLNQRQLSHILFPLGELTKQQVRQIAESQGFVNARKRDSQDICFIPDGDYAAFLERFTGKTYPQGTYLDLQGQPLGQHQGAVRYTIGQRKGLGIALGQPMYVCGKDMACNTVTLGPNEALYAQALLASDWNWLPFPALTAPMAVTAKIRHSQTSQAATVYPEADGTARVVFAEPQRAITPGQAVVLYQGQMVVGSGTILSKIS